MRPPVRVVMRRALAGSVGGGKGWCDRHCLCYARGMSRIFPGLLLCLAVSGVAFALERAEIAATGRAWIETLVLAILVGTAVRTAWTPSERWCPGIDFSGKFLL